MAARSIIIIGGGIAGLSAGCYAQMNGYQSRIFELHTQPGGLCTSWTRQGFTFDGCIHWLVGTGKKSGFHRIWEELGALQGREIVDHDEFLRVVGPEGRTFILYTNPDRLEEHLLALSPQDAPVIKEFTSALRKIARASMPTGSPTTLAEWIAMLKGLPGFLPLLGIMRKYQKVSLESFTARFQDPFVKQALKSMFDLPDFPLIAAMMSLGWMGAHDAGYPMGGSLKFSQAIEKRYCALGGEISYKSKVSKILVENGEAVGICLENGHEYRADIVISAADGHATLFNMLEGRFLADELRNYYDHQPIFAPIIQVSLGVGRDLSDQPHMATYILDQPISIGGEERHQVGVKHYCFDPTLAPAGKSVAMVTFGSNYLYWKKLADEPEQYEAEKKTIAIQVMQELEKIYPGLTGQVEVVDVATPLTYERYTGNWQGSVEGWMITTRNMNNVTSGKGLSKTLPGLENFYMIGQWVEPGGGVQTAAISAKKAIQLICKQDHRSFTTTVPG